MNVRLYVEGRMLRHKTSGALARIHTIVRMERLSRTPHSEKRKYTYRYVAKNTNGGGVNILDIKALTSDWELLMDRSMLETDDKSELEAYLNMALEQEDYEFCSLVRDKIKSLGS